MRGLLSLSLPLLLLQGCVGNPVAQQLERSFDAGTSAPQTDVKTTGVRAEEKPAAPAPAPVPQPSTVDLPNERTSVAATENASPEPKAEPITATAGSVPLVDATSETPPLKVSKTMEPYRITIRLSGADPAAPAEAVTRALRRADVPFSVERIERIEP